MCSKMRLCSTYLALIMQCCPNFSVCGIPKMSRVVITDTVRRLAVPEGYVDVSGMAGVL